MRKNRPSTLKILGIVFCFILILSGCSTRDPSDLRHYYAENYPASSPKIKRKVDKVEKPKENLSPTSVQTVIEEMGQNKRTKLDSNESDEYPETEQFEEKLFKSETLVKGQLQPPRDLNLAAEKDSQEDYGAATMIESKLFRLVEDAYNRRDPTEFVRLYNFFLESFPHSSRKAYLDEKLKSFFYSEELEVTKLKDALVEITYPDARTLEELSQYFSRLNSNGLAAVQIEVVQLLGTPIYLFANPQSNEGYYFGIDEGKVVDKLLSKIASIAHEAGLKVMVSLPLRNHPQLSSFPNYIMDESWNAYQNGTLPNGKLDLLNPYSKKLLQSIIKSLLSSNIDGIIFKDDFTYAAYEGFSKKALDRYKIETGRTVVFNRMFRPIKQLNSDQIEMLIGEDFDDVALWRTQEIKQLLWDLIATIKNTNKEIVVGFELTPEMILDSKLSVKWYSTGLHYVKDLNADFFVLKWRKYKSMVESDPADFKRAALILREALPSKKELFVKVPLGDDTRNVIKLNRRINENAELLEEMSMAKIAIGPVSRIDNYGLLIQ